MPTPTAIRSGRGQLGRLNTVRSSPRVRYAALRRCRRASSLAPPRRAPLPPGKPPSARQACGPCLGRLLPPPSGPS